METTRIEPADPYMRLFIALLLLAPLTTAHGLGAQSLIPTAPAAGPAAAGAVGGTGFAPHASLAVAAGLGFNDARVVELRLESHSSPHFVAALGADLNVARASSTFGIVNPNGPAGSGSAIGDRHDFATLFIEPSVRVGSPDARAMPYVGVRLSRVFSAGQAGSGLALVGGVDVRLSPRWEARAGLLAGFASAQDRGTQDNGWTAGMVTFNVGIALAL